MATFAAVISTSAPSASALYYTLVRGTAALPTAGTRTLMTARRTVGATSNWEADITWDASWVNPRIEFDDGVTMWVADGLACVRVVQGSGGEVTFDTDLSDDIAAVLARLGAGTVRIIGQVVNYDLVIGRGESYNTTVGQTLVWTKAAGDTWPTDITGWTVTLNARKKSGNQNTGTATLTVATGTVTQATGDSQAFRVDLTAAQTTGLAEGAWTLSVTLTSGLNVKAIRGNMIVLPELPVDA